MTPWICSMRMDQEVEKTLFFQTAYLFNLEVDLIFYDTTTASFSVDYEDDPEHHAKEGFWAPEVVVAMAVTREDIPVRSWVLPGNTVDASTVEKVRVDLRGWNLGRAMFVAGVDNNRRPFQASRPKAGVCLNATSWPTVALFG